MCESSIQLLRHVGVHDSVTLAHTRAYRRRLTSYLDKSEASRGQSHASHRILISLRLVALWSLGGFLTNCSS